MATLYDLGDVVRLTGTFTDSNGTAADPTTVTLEVKDPSGNEATYTYALSQITKSSTGIYYKDVTTDEGGTWYYRWLGSGTVASADEGYFYVEDSKFG